MRQRVRSRFEGSPRQRQNGGFSGGVEWVTESPAFAAPPCDPCSAPPPSTASENSAAPPHLYSRGLGWLASLALGVSEVFQQQQQQFDEKTPAPEHGQTQVFDAFSDWCELEQEDASERNGLPASAALQHPSEGSLYFPNSRSRILGSTKVSTATKTSSSLRRRIRNVNERPSRSYANMLKAGVPQSAIRYHMRGNSCSASTVQSILGNDVPGRCLKCNERGQVSPENNSSVLLSGALKPCKCHIKSIDEIQSSTAHDSSEAPNNHIFADRRQPRNATPKISDSDLIEADEKAIRSFRGMMNAGVPKSVVKERMVLDGLSPSIIAEVTREPLSEVEAQNAISNGRAVSSSKDADVKKALMALFNSDPFLDEQRTDFSSLNHTSTGEVKTPNKVSTELQMCPKYAERSIVVPVEQSCPADLDQDKSLPTKYRNMVQAGVPPLAVRHKMLADGIPESEIGLLLNSKSGSIKVSTEPTAGNRAQSLTDVPESDSLRMKYNKMVQAGVPQMAVRHKMVADGIPDSEIDLLLEYKSESSEVNAESALVDSRVRSHADAPKSGGQLVKYKKMVQAGVPSMAVKHKMVADGIPESEFASVIRPENAQSGEANVYVVEKSDSTELPVDDGSIQKYKKMLLAGVPPMAVRHKMVVDGIPDSEIDYVLQSKKTTNGVVPAEHEQVLTKYRAMIKAGVPPPAVEQRMIKDSVDKQLIMQVVGGNSPSCSGHSAAVAASTLITVHWTPLGLSKEDLSKSVWGSCLSSMVPSKEMVRLEELFTKKPAVKSGKFAKSKSDGSLSKSAQVKKKAAVLDNARMQNLAIGLRSFRSVDPVSIGQSLNNFNSNEFSLEQLPRLSEMIPTEAEISAVQMHAQRLDSGALKGDDGVRSDGEGSVRGAHGLESPEAFCLGFLGVQRPRKKLNVLTFMKSFSTVAYELLEKLNLLSRSIDQIEKSTKLAQLLSKILTVGNVMNKGTSKGGAHGITVDSLLKLTQTKSTCKTMSFLDFVVDSLLNAGDDARSILTFADDLPDLVAASKMPLGELSSQVAQLQADLREAESELKLLRKDDAERATMHLGHRGPGSDAVEAGMLRANGQPATQEPKSPACSNPRANLLATIEAKSKKSETASELEPAESISSDSSSCPRANLLDAIKNNSSKTKTTTGSNSGGGSSLLKVVGSTFSNHVAEVHDAIRAKASNGNSCADEKSIKPTTNPRANLLAAIEARVPKEPAGGDAGPSKTKGLGSRSALPSGSRTRDSSAAQDIGHRNGGSNGSESSPTEASTSSPPDARTHLLAAIQARRADGCVNDDKLKSPAGSSKSPPPVLGKSADALERCVKVASARVHEVKVAESKLRARSKALAAFFGEREQDATHIITCLATFAGMVKESKAKVAKGPLK